MDYTLKTDYGFLFIVIVIILSFLVSYYYYKNSKVEGIQKKFFTVLRFFSSLFIILLISSPVISFIKTISQDSVNIFLIDNSQSLLIDKRDEKLKEVLNDKIKDAGSGGSENLYFLFSGNLQREISKDEFESIAFTGINNFETNLTGTMNSLRERLSGKNLSSVTIISDGIVNEGGNPVLAAKSLNVPVNHILLGDTIQKNDLVLRNVFYNKTAFIESNVPVNIEINSYNYDREIKINVYEDDRLIDTKTQIVLKGQSEYSLSVNVLSNVEKISKYRIEIEGLDDEITLKNNFQDFFIKYVNNKFKVLVLSGGPSADFAFISEEIKKISNFESTFLTQKSPSEYYEGTLPDLSGFDCFILINYPTSVTNLNILNEIKDKLEKNNSSLIFFAGRNTDYKKLSILEDRLPFKLNSYSESEEETGIKSVSILNNEIFKNQSLISSVNSFPNIFKTKSTFSINPAAESFLVMSNGSEPAFVIQNSEKNKSAAFLAYGLYKWRLSRQTNNSDDVLNYLLTTSIVAVTNKEEKKAFTIETTKPVYSKYENVRFESRITNFELQGGEQIRVKITGNNFNGELELFKTDNKFYEGEINIPADGLYEYTAGLYSRDNLVQSIQNKFLIGENNFEYKLTKADNSVLNNLSNDSEGKNYTSMQSSEINNSLKSLNEKSGTEYKSLQNVELNINPYYLCIAIFLLCLEWFLRKRNNLP